jgi:hypothetical protein
MSYASVRPDVLYAWSGPSLLVVNTRGECAEGQRLSGYYFREARFVRTLQLRIDDHALMLRLWRNRNASSHFEMLSRQGTVHVVRQPPPQSIEAGFAAPLARRSKPSCAR